MQVRGSTRVMLVGRVRRTYSIVMRIISGSDSGEQRLLVKRGNRARRAQTCRQWMRVHRFAKRRRENVWQHPKDNAPPLPYCRLPGVDSHNARHTSASRAVNDTF